jgi:Plasmid pRiA4b ORF-3-like protein
MARAPTASSTTCSTVVTLKITLKGSKPPIWRRVLVSTSVTFGGLSKVILGTMGWRGGHLHDFNVDGRDYSERGMLEGVADESRLTLNSVINKGRASDWNGVLS